MRLNPLWLMLLLAIHCSFSDTDDDDDLANGDDTSEDDTSDDDDTTTDDDDGFPFVEFQWQTAEPDVVNTRLCDEAADPDNASDKINIHCAMEGADFTDGPAAPKDQLVVMAYNLERGIDLDPQIDWLLNDPGSPHPDVLLISEADRGCSRTGTRNTLREFAEALGMYYVYGVEFIELPRTSGSGGVIESMCEHGNGILSRYPLGNVKTIRHAVNKSWYLTPEERADGGEPRLGGRVAIYADVKVGDKYLHAYALHFESSPADSAFRDPQAAELAADGLTKPYTVAIGGDTNAPFYFLDLASGTTNDATTQAFLTRGYADAHISLDPEGRGTRGGFVIDLIFVRNGTASAPGLCPDERCGDLSDHLPVWATLALE